MKLYSLSFSLSLTLRQQQGHAHEPECLAIAGLLGRRCKLILSGDPMQLGPVIRSPVAKKFQLETSLLERLTQRQVYERYENEYEEYGGYDPRIITQLGDSRFFSSFFFFGSLTLFL